MAAEAATFALASAIHLAVGFTDAAIPELLIAAVLGVGSSAILSRRAHTWSIALGATAFAAFGTVLGLTIIAAGRQDVPDLTYHASILAALALTLTALLRAAADPAAGHMNPRHDQALPGRQNGRSGSPTTQPTATSSAGHSGGFARLPT